MFQRVREISDVAQNILKKRYFAPEESSWEELVNRVCSENTVLYFTEDERNAFKEMLLNTYFVPNSPCLVNSGKENAGKMACFVLDFKDTIEEIYKTKLGFAQVARKGGGCGTTLSKIRPKGSIVNGSAHGYAGGPIKFADTISHDMSALTQAGFREMAIMFTISCYHPDIVEFITAKTDEGKIANANISVVVDDAFMQKVENDETYWTEFDGIKYQEYKARDIFNLIVEGAWRNGEPGILYYNKLNDSPYKYSGQEIMATNPCVSGTTLIRTTKGNFQIKDLVGKEVDVYCKDNDGSLTIARATNIVKTRSDAEVITIFTTKGQLTCTPDHLIFTRNRGYVKACELTKQDKLVGLNRKMSGEKYVSVALTGGKYVKEHRFILAHYTDITGKDVHHLDGDTLNNSVDNLEAIAHSEHSILTNLGHPNWCSQDKNTGRFLKKESKAKRKSVKLNEFDKCVNLKIINIKESGTEDVYDMTVEKYHNFLANNIIVHNCAEQGLPPNGSCNLGSFDVSKLYIDGKIDYELLTTGVKLAVKFLNNVIDTNEYPNDEIKEWALANRPIGIGIMGFADLLLHMKIPYGGEESLNILYDLLNHIYTVAKEQSEILGMSEGCPENCKVLPDPRRNITLTTVAPTGTVSLIAGCSSGIEPIFSEITVRNDKTGIYLFENDLASQPYFRCAVAANGATEVTWEEHINVLATAQSVVDSGVSKTCNFPTNTHRETIAKAFIMAWKMGCKGLAVYRNGSRKVEVLSPKNLKKDKCPKCDGELIALDGIKKCTNPACGFVLEKEE